MDINENHISPDRWESRFTWKEGDVVFGPEIPGMIETLNELYLGKITKEEAVERYVASGAFDGSRELANRSIQALSESWKTSIPNVLNSLQSGRYASDTALKRLVQMGVEPNAAKKLIEQKLLEK